MTVEELRAMILTVQTQLDQLADKVDRVEAQKLARMADSIEKEKREREAQKHLIDSLFDGFADLKPRVAKLEGIVAKQPAKLPMLRGGGHS